MMAAMQKADDALLLHATFTALPSASCASFTLAVPLIPATSSSGLSPPFVLHLRGPSGVGKTQTALALLSGAPPRGMSLNLNWHASIPAASRVGMLFQNGVLIDELSVGANLALAGGDPTSSSIEALLAAVNLERSALEKMPSELSGGMLRRAALAQLLCQRKRLIILDEPFAGLDDGAAAGVAEPRSHHHAAWICASQRRGTSHRGGARRRSTAAAAPSPVRVTTSSSLRR